MKLLLKLTTIAKARTAVSAALSWMNTLCNVSCHWVLRLHDLYALTANGKHYSVLLYTHLKLICTSLLALIVMHKSALTLNSQQLTLKFAVSNLAFCCKRHTCSRSIMKNHTCVRTLVCSWAKSCSVIYITA